MQLSGHIHIYILIYIHDSKYHYLTGKHSVSVEISTKLAGTTSSANNLGAIFGRMPTQGLASGKKI